MGHQTLLVADIGGTKSRCAIASPGSGIGQLQVFRNAEFDSLEKVLAAYVHSLPAGLRPAMAAIAVAAPLRGDDVRMINIGWQFSRSRLQQEFGFAKLHVLNDFAAVAWALPILAPADLLQIGGGAPAAGYPKIVLGPGTGLGLASLIAAGNRWHAIAGEGGHVTLAGRNDREDSIIRLARERFAHCSAERLLSGHGLSFLHEALHGGAPLAAEQIGALIDAGERQACETLDIFFEFLATVASNAAVTLGALGGVYIGGGIVPRYTNALIRSAFRQRFEDKGRYIGYMRAIPTFVITKRDPALTGLYACVQSLSGGLPVQTP